MNFGHNLQKYLAEFLGVFYLIVTIVLVTQPGGTAAVPGNAVFAPLAIGFVLMALIYSMGHVSGAQYNPAVTIIFAARRDLPIPDAVMFVIVQVAGGVAGALCGALLSAAEVATPGPATTTPRGIAQAFTAEVVYTSLLMMVILHVAVSKQKGNGFFALAISLVVVAGAAATGPISGAVFNPAVGTGLIVARCLTGDCAPMSHIWLYWVAPCLGAAIGQLFFFIMTTGDEIPTPQRRNGCTEGDCEDSETVCLRAYEPSSPTEPTNVEATAESNSAQMPSNTGPNCLRARVCRTAGM